MYLVLVSWRDGLAAAVDAILFPQAQELARKFFHGCELSPSTMRLQTRRAKVAAARTPAGSDSVNKADRQRRLALNQRGNSKTASPISALRDDGLAICPGMP